MPAHRGRRRLVAACCSWFVKERLPYEECKEEQRRGCEERHCGVCDRQSMQRGFCCKLLDPRIDPADDDNDTVLPVSRHGHVEVVRVLLVDARADPADVSNYVTRQARRVHVEVVRVLPVDARVDRRCIFH